MRKPYEDFGKLFDFVQETLLYNDAPLEGHLRSTTSGELFAFRCHVVVHDALWHWVLVPVASTSESPASAIERLRRREAESWVSLIEDQRSDDHSISIATLPASVLPVEL